MEEVLEQFENTVISQDTSNESKTNFEGLYKNWGKLGNQEERRREILQVQKSNRYNKLDKFRGILDLVSAVEESEIFSQQQNAYYRPTIYVAGFNKVSPTYSRVLMMSEWIIEKPKDFSVNWYVVPCPKGARMLVIANHGTTKCYSKYGHFKFETRTVLPGGNKVDVKKKNQCCVLDCFYHDYTKTMYVLDLLAWNCQPMTDGEAEFRHYWLESQLLELPELKEITKKNQLIFKLLPKVSCDADSFNRFMSTYPAFEGDTPKVDGLLFYHKRAHYIAGETPLVGWLFPFMCTEVFGEDYRVNETYMAERPEFYVNHLDFIKQFEEIVAKKTRSGRSSTNKMDTANDTVATKCEKNVKNAMNKVEIDQTANEMETTDVSDAEKDVKSEEQTEKENINKTNEMETAESSTNLPKDNDKKK